MIQRVSLLFFPQNPLTPMRLEDFERAINIARAVAEHPDRMSIDKVDDRVYIDEVGENKSSTRIMDIYLGSCEIVVYEDYIGEMESIISQS